MKNPSIWAQRLGYAGLIPFVLLSLATWLLDASQQTRAVAALVAYGATIASFVGALHWGLVMRDAALQTLPTMAWGVLPSLLAWAALLLPPQMGLWLIVAILWLCFAVDRRRYPALYVAGWLRLRRVLTVVASTACGLAALRGMV